MAARQRLSASVDADLIAAGQAAVAAGSAANLSAWVNQALRRQSEHDRRLAALGDVIAEFEAEHGKLTDAEIEDASRWARERAVVVRGGSRAEGRARTA
jgi:hypothetical protein